jgi:hypothetical protein
MNHQRQADAVVGVTMDGWVFALDRRTGAPLLRAPVRLPGAPAVVAARPPAWVSGPANRATDAAFGQTEDGLSLFTTIFDVIFGSGVNVANYYGIDPGSGRLYVAATAPDEQDGAVDGVSRNGALYLLELRGERAGGYALEVVRSFVFEGGTGSTPTIRVDGGLVVVSDENGNVIVWFATGGNTVEVGTEGVRAPLEIGRTYQIKGTVKKHEEYFGVKQTCLTRCKVQGTVENQETK